MDDRVVEYRQPVDATALLGACPTARRRSALHQRPGAGGGGCEGELCRVAAETGLAVEDSDERVVLIMMCATIMVALRRATLQREILA